MKKWRATIEVTIQAETRKEVWATGRDLIEKHLRGLATLTGVTLDPVPDPDDWIAINEPIKEQR